MPIAPGSKKIPADQRLQTATRVHFVGIQGVAMAGLALILSDRGKTVAGSDVAEPFATKDKLRQRGITLYEGFAAENLAWGPELVIAGASWPDTHVELVAAKARGLRVVAESQLRGFLSRQRSTIAVTGVHGKSTTTALIAWALHVAGKRPSYLIGAPEVSGLPSSGRWDRGEHFVVEGDEYAASPTDRTAKFLDLDPWATVVTSLEWEHVDVYPDVAAMEQAFSALVAQTRGLAIACVDWPAVERATVGAKRRLTYGVTHDADFRVANFRLTDSGSAFTVARGGKILGELRSRLLGQHNALNATAALAIALEVGVEWETFAQALASFGGLARRLQITVVDGVTWIDDYGHHPTEISRTLEAIRERYPRAKIWVVFQPHLASRTRALMARFAKSFAPANRVLIADLFASAREAGDPQAARDLAQAVAKYHEAVRYSGSLADTAAYLRQYLQPGDVVVTMGAGDVYKVRELVAKQGAGSKE